MKRAYIALGAFLILAIPATAPAHTLLRTAEAPAGSMYEAVLIIGHGCEGSPTVEVRVRIPPGMVAVKPMPKPGWDLQVNTGPYPEPVLTGDESFTEGVQEISWSGGSLPDAWYDDFIFRGRLPDAEPGTVIYFPVLQNCLEGEHRWIETTGDGESDSPAPAVTISEAEAEHHH